jgi:hypothetical protein
MQSAKDWYRCDVPDLLGPAKIGNIFMQRWMRPDLIVVRSVSLQDVAQVRFAEHDEVVERFAAYRSDQPLYVAVLPRRSRGGRVMSDLHRTNAAGVGWTETPSRSRIK